MGYNTRYTLTTLPESHRSDVLKSVNQQVGYDPFEDECKWYCHEDDMLVVSRLHPNTIITLHGAGEEQGDEWVSHMFNGETVRHRAPKWEPPSPPEAWATKVNTYDAG